MSLFIYIFMVLMSDTNLVKSVATRYIPILFILIWIIVQQHRSEK